MNEITDEHLDEIETDRLVAALRRRSTASIIGLCNTLDDKRESKVCYYSGGMAGLGMMTYVSEYVRRAFFEPSNLIGQ